jgi:hypothetical protein
MRLLNSGVIAVSIGAAIITIFSFLFYYDITRKIDAGRAEVVGTITYKRRLAQRKYASQVVWEEVEQNEPVYNYDAIRTAEGSEAVVRIKDGTQFTINENSLVVVAFAKDAINISFDQGSITASRQNVSDPKMLNIKAGNATISLEKSDVKVASQQGKEVSLTVQKGDATISAGAVAKKVGEYQNAVVAGAGVDVNSQAVRLQTPMPDSHLVTTGGGRDVRFTWLAVKNAKEYSIEVSKNRGFTRPVFNRRGIATAGSASLEPGEYYWRVSALKKKGTPPEFSETRRFLIVREDPVGLIVPADDEKFYYMKKPPLVQFKWMRSPTASGYRLLIAKDPAMKGALREIDVPSTSIGIDTLEKGVYYWKIVAQSALKGEGIESGVRRLTVSTTDSIEPPEPLYPHDGITVSRGIMKSGELAFTWRKSPELAGAKFTLARDRQFKNIVYSTEQKADSLSPQSDLAQGSYWWRVEGVLDPARRTPPSPPRKLVVSEAVDIELLAPGDKETVSSFSADRVTPVRFSWKRADIPGLYQVEIAGVREFTPEARKEKVRGYNLSLEDLSPGNYYWRVSLLSRDGQVLMKSSVRQVKVMDRLEAPVIVSPNNGEKVNMRNVKALSLRWRGLRDADRYEIGIFEMRGRGGRKIFSTVTDDTDYEFNDLAKLDESRFFMTVQAVDLDRGKVVRKSPVSKSVFEITLGGPLKKPELKLPKVIYLE